MSEVKRYNVVADKYGDGTVEASPTGSVVFYEDYAALKEQFDFKQNLTEQIVELQRQRDALATEFWLTRHFIPEDAAVPIMKDALNEIKAEGVEILIGKLQQLIDEGVFDAKEIGVAAGAVYEGAQIAAQLRTGELS